MSDFDLHDTFRPKIFFRKQKRFIFTTFSRQSEVQSSGPRWVRDVRQHGCIKMSGEFYRNGDEQVNLARLKISIADKLSHRIWVHKLNEKWVSIFDLFSKLNWFSVNGSYLSQVPSYMSEFVMVTAWIQDSGMHLYSNTDIGGKYNVLPNGELYINNAGPADAFKTYTCRTVNRLTGDVQTSAYPGRIIVTEPKGIVQPRINVEKHSIRQVVINGQTMLPCIAQGHPAPTYRWVVVKSKTRRFQ